MVKVFLIPVHVTALDESIMPQELSGAYVDCYVSGASYVEATKKALGKLLQDGLNPEEVLPDIREMSAISWSEHVSESWPDYLESLPGQTEFEELMRNGEVVYGPFSSYQA